MNEFLTTVLTFPTLPFTIVLACCVIYWFVAGLGGLVDFHIHDHGAADISHHADGASVGLLARFGLGGVPFMLMISIVALIGWVVSFYLQLWVLPLLPAALAWLVGAGLLVGTLVVAVFLTSVVLRPIRWALAHLSKNNAPIVLVGRQGTVISPELNERMGRIEVNDGGAGLILQARAPAGHAYPRGTLVIVTHHDSEKHQYDVVSQTDFNKS